MREYEELATFLQNNASELSKYVRNTVGKDATEEEITELINQLQSDKEALIEFISMVS